MLKSVLASIAAFGLAVAPIAAQAGTRAADAVVSLDLAAGQYQDDDICEDNDAGLSEDDWNDLCGEGGWWWLVGGAILIALGFVIAGDADEDNASPGAN